MKDILARCSRADFDYLSTLLDSHAAFADDVRRRELLEACSARSENTELIELIDRQIRFYGTPTVAHLPRSIFGSRDDGVGAAQLIGDVAGKLGIAPAQGGSIETRLEHLACGVAEQAFSAKTPAQLAGALRELGIGAGHTERVIERLKHNGQAPVLPVLNDVLGPKIALAVVETIVIGIIARIVGPEATRVLATALVKRNPWMHVPAPLTWALPGAWPALDLPGTAYRKSVPICLYLGVVALRDAVMQPAWA